MMAKMERMVHLVFLELIGPRVPLVPMAILGKLANLETMALLVTLVFLEKMEMRVKRGNLETKDPREMRELGAPKDPKVKTESADVGHENLAASLAMSTSSPVTLSQRKSPSVQRASNPCGLGTPLSCLKVMATVWPKSWVALDPV